MFLIFCFTNIDLSFSTFIVSNILLNICVSYCPFANLDDKYIHTFLIFSTKHTLLSVDIASNLVNIAIIEDLDTFLNSFKSERRDVDNTCPSFICFAAVSSLTSRLSESDEFNILSKNENAFAAVAVGEGPIPLLEPLPLLSLEENERRPQDFPRDRRRGFLVAAVESLAVGGEVLPFDD